MARVKISKHFISLEESKYKIFLCCICICYNGTHSTTFDIYFQLASIMLVRILF